MRILKIAVIAAALTGFAAPAYADGFESATTSMRVPISGKSNQQICRAVQALGILPGTLSDCIREARANRDQGWVTLTVYAGPEPVPAAEPASEQVPPPPAPPPQRLADPGGEDPGRTWAPPLWMQVLMGLAGAAAIIGGFLYLNRPKPEEVAEATNDEDETGP